MDVVKLVEEGKCRFEYSTVTSKKDGYELDIQVFRDAMKFDDVPSLNYRRTPYGGSPIRDGVRLPASAYELQEIADMLNCMLMTPKVIDMIWLQAELKFDCVVNINGQIVATSYIEAVHDKIEAEITKLGGDDGTKLVSCVGKYWCLMNHLKNAGELHGAWVCCNYGWCARHASGPGIPPGVQCWQRPGFRHGGTHLDPSQTIRLMHRIATLHKPDGTSVKIDLHDIAAHPKLSYLLHHEGPLKYLRQKGPQPREAILLPDLDPDMWTVFNPGSIF
jgi:hypothetical protein